MSLDYPTGSARSSTSRSSAARGAPAGCAGDGVKARGCQRRPHFVVADTKKAATNNHTIPHTHPNANPKTAAGKMTNDRATTRNAATGCLRFQSGMPALSRSDAQVAA